MEGIGQVLARRTGSSDASEMPRRVSPSPLDTFSPLPTRERPTTAGTDAETSPVPELLLRLASAPDARESAPPGSRECSTPENAAREEEVPQQLPSPRASAPEQAPEPLRPELLRPKSSAPGLPVLEAALHECAAAADALRSMAADEARLFGFVEAADFAGRVEEISRSLEYLQVVAAQAVERTRKEAQQASPGPSAFGAGPGWRTGWTEPEPASETPASSVNAAMSSEVRSTPDAATAAADSTLSPLDDGYRNAAEFLRARLRISIGEARRRLALAADVLPQTGMAGQQIPARREVLADALSSGDLVRPGPRRSSAPPWTQSGNSPMRTPSPGWNTPSPPPRWNPTRTSSPK